jgi:hypothetical protein
MVGARGDNTSRNNNRRLLVLSSCRNWFTSYREQLVKIVQAKGYSTLVKISSVAAFRRVIDLLGMRPAMFNPDSFPHALKLMTSYVMLEAANYAVAICKLNYDKLSGDGNLDMSEVIRDFITRSDDSLYPYLAPETCSVTHNMVCAIRQTNRIRA